MLLVAMGGAGAGLAQATTIYNFSCITNNGNGCTSLAPQLTLDVSDAGSGKIQFLIINAGPIASVISEIYWADPSNLLSAFASPTFAASALDVVFQTGATPGQLPGDTSINEFPVSAVNPSPHNGINTGDSLGVRFVLAGSYASVISAMNAGTMRVGIHVQAIGQNGGSDSLVTNGGQVPEPATTALIGVGLAALGLLRKRRKG